MRRGQHYTVFQMLQGAILASVMLLIVYGVVSSLAGQIPASDPFTIGAEVLSSAYAGAGSGVYFKKEAVLVAQEFDADALRAKSGLPEEVEVGLVCRHPYCLNPVSGFPVTEESICQTQAESCKSMLFDSGDKINICAKCRDFDSCAVFFGEAEC